VLQATGTPSPSSAVASGGNTQAVLTGFSVGEASNGNNEGFRYPGPHGFSPPPQHYMPLGYPWGMPFGNNEATRTGATEAQVSHGQRENPHFSIGHPTPHVAAIPLVHANQHEEGQIYHSDSVAGDDRVGYLEERVDARFEAMQKELKTMKGKEVFGQSMQDLCLILDGVIPPKFKVPDFEKYKGDTCPENHLIMYARKMTAYRDNEPLLIHCFQESLTGPAAVWYMNLRGISTFSELADAFIQQYKYNWYLAPNRRELQAMSQGDKETFKEYAQRFIQKSAQVRPALEEREVNELFFETLSPFYSEKMYVVATQKFTDIVDTGMRVEEWVLKGRFPKEIGSSGSATGGSSGSASNGAKKYGNGYPKKNTQEVGMVAHGGSQPVYPSYPLIANIQQPTLAPQRPPPYYPPLYQQPYPQNPQQFFPQPYYPQPQQPRPQAPQQPNRPRRTYFPPIPMPYRDLLPSVLTKGLAQTRQPPRVPNPLPNWYRADRTCDFHQGAPGHDIENCYSFKETVHKLIESGDLSFTDTPPNAQHNPLPPHGPAVNMVESYQENGRIHKVQDIKTPLVPIHAKMCKADLFSHDHATCNECSANPRGCLLVRRDIQMLMDAQILVVEREDKSVCVITPVFKTQRCLEAPCKPVSGPLVIYVSKLCSSQQVVPYDCGTSKEASLSPTTSVDNIAEGSKILRSGRVLPSAVQVKVSEPVLESVQGRDPSKGKVSSQPKEIVFEHSDEVLKLIKRSEYKVVDQLLQTPSKISILSLLLNSEAHREALLKVLDQAYVDHEVTLGQFEHIVGNVTACNNLGFSDEELRAEGKHHNLALHISVKCKSDSISNVLIDTGSSLNVMPLATLEKLLYPGIQLRATSVSVRAFDGSRKVVLGDVDLPISVGPHEFKVTFQVMDIPASYSCLLGRPWIHEAGAVTSTLHQKLKFVSHGKLIIVNGEYALLVSHLSAFSYIGGGDVGESSVQGFSAEGGVKKGETCMDSLKDA